MLAIHLGRHYHEGPARLGRDATETTRPSMSMSWLHDGKRTSELYIFYIKFLFRLLLNHTEKVIITIVSKQ